MTDYDALAAELAAVKARLAVAERWIKQSRGDYPNAARYVDEQIRRQDKVCSAIDAARAADSSGEVQP